MALCGRVRTGVLNKSTIPRLLKRLIDNGVRFMSSHQTFRARDVQIELSQKPVDFEKVDMSFGHTFTHHMLEIQFDGSKWLRPRISPFHYLQLHPAAKSLHYAVQLFEGLKAFRGNDGVVRLFRPEKNMGRLIAGASRVALPTFDPDEFLELIKKLLVVDEQWVPYQEASSLYIRPTFISNEKMLKVEQPKDCLLYVIMSPAGPYFPTGFKPISLLADPQYVRAWPGGVGAYKLGANYGPTLAVQKIAAENNCHQVLWLFGEEEYITEIGAMNMFMVMRDSNGDIELVTPPSDGLILPGVNRQSILELSREWKEFKVTERRITMTELIKASQDKTLVEVFASGTAVSVCPISEIHYKGQIISIPTTDNETAMFERFYNVLSDIQYGRIPHPWAVPIK